VKELLKPFGEPKSFNLLKDKEGNSKGTAIFEYVERMSAEMALKGLNNLDIGGMKLTTQVRSKWLAWGGGGGTPGVKPTWRPWV
jgi:RNA recognition motif-containing protein